MESDPAAAGAMNAGESGRQLGQVWRAVGLPAGMAARATTHIARILVHRAEAAAVATESPSAEPVRLL